MADEFLKNTIDIEYKTDSFEFRIPTVEDELQLGFIERNIRRDFEGRAMSADELKIRRPLGEAEGLDFNTRARVQAIAGFQRLLVKSDAKDNWCWSKDPQGRPVIDYRVWDATHLDEAVAIWWLFMEELTRFRSGGVAQDKTV